MNWPPQLRVTRMSGAENTFFIVNIFDPLWAQLFPQLKETDKTAMTMQLCEGFYGCKTDGLLFLRPQKDYDFAWDFFNSDGSNAEMCGNAARCATLFFHRRVRSQKTLRFLTGAGEVLGEVLSPHRVRVQMTEISMERSMRVLETFGFFANTGVPHFVIESQPNLELARRLRQVPDFGPPGANITFVENLRENHIQAVTFERGVEDWTRACGTGAVAAALYLQSKKGHKEFVDVQMPGGVLSVQGAAPGLRPFLIGPVQFDFDLESWEVSGEKI
jgi:diaminopimelate epimerase